jgi:MoaA/NifB/PqqE/SkfB family radical SAM enzyme
MLKELSFKLLFNYLYDFFVISFKRTPILKPLFFTFYTNLRCNFNCSYCSFAASGQTRNYHNELDTCSVINLLKIIRKETTAIYFTGGEPLLRNDIIEILKASKNQGFKSITVNTNMSLIHKKMDVLNYLTNLVASFDMTNEEEYSKIVGTSTSVVHQVKQNIIACASLQKQKEFQMTVNCVVTPQLISQTREVMNFCFKHKINFAIVPAELEGGIINEELKNSNEYQQLLIDIIAAKKNNKPIFGSLSFLETIRKFKHFECFPTLTPHLYPNGDLFYPCEPLQKIAANLLEVGDYKKALKIGMEKFGNLPMCKNKCHKACYIEPSVLVKNPISVIRELK